MVLMDHHHLLPWFGWLWCQFSVCLFGLCLYNKLHHHYQHQTKKNAKLFVVDNVVLLNDATKTATACPSSADSESSSHDSSCPEGLMLHYLCTIWLCARCLFTDFMSPLCYITHKHTSSVYLLNFALTIMWQSLQETKQY